jgi:hypothetical protein
MKNEAKKHGRLSLIMARRTEEAQVFYLLWCQRVGEEETSLWKSSTAARGDYPRNASPPPIRDKRLLLPSTPREASMIGCEQGHFDT